MRSAGAAAGSTSRSRTFGRVTSTTTSGESGRRDFAAAAARAAAELIRDPAVATAWDQPSALAEMTVGALAGHLAYQILVIPPALADPPPEQPTVSLAEHFSRVRWIGARVDDDISRRIREDSERTAADGHQALVARVDSAVTDLADLLTGAGDGAVRLPLWPSWSTTIDDMLVTRLVEIVVHADDLAVSVGVASPAFPEAVVDAVLDVLTRLAVRRHGYPAVLRALSRSERAPETIAAF
jgi:hypothetical protein